MKKYNSTSSGGYSIIAAVLMVWFLLILTTSTLNLVLQEMQDGRGRQWYLSAYAGAEWALELALLDIKVQWYGYDDDSFIDNEILGSVSKYPKISYEFNSRVETYVWTLTPLWVDIIPLFSVDASWWINAIDDIDFNITGGNIAWNLVTQSWGTSWVWNFDMTESVWEKTLVEAADDTRNLNFNSTEKIEDILSGKDYLILQNLDTTQSATYKLIWDGGGFTLPRAEIISSARIWKYTQNLQTTVDNTEFLWILRYSVYSGN